jgi:L-fucose mutarotase
MLKHIDPILSADLLWLLAAMGHGDDLALVDANHPAERIARRSTTGRLIRLPGLALPVVLGAILTVFPLDDFEQDPVRVMAPVRNTQSQPEVQREAAAVISRSLGRDIPFAPLERGAFYATAGESFGVVQVGDPRPYGCFLLRKGVSA